MKNTYSAPSTKEVRMRPAFMVVIVLWVLIVGCVLGGIVAGAYGYVQGQAYAQRSSVATQKPDVYDLWVLTNNDRQNAGIPPVKLNNYLNASAQAKCNDMVTQNYFGHNNPQGVDSRVAINKFVDVSRLSTDENLAEGYNTAQDTETAWLASPVHREGIMNPRYTDVGLAVCTGSSGTLVVEHFIGV